MTRDLPRFSNVHQWVIAAVVGVAMGAATTAVRAEIARAHAEKRAEVCLAAAKVDHVRVGEFVDKNSYQFCYSDADVDVCVFRKVTP